MTSEAEVSDAIEDRTNERSSIGFPYADLDTAVEVAKALYARSGRGSCDLDGLAAELNHTVNGAFRIKTGAAKVFGFIEKEGRDATRLTQLGIRIVSPEEERSARADAFLNVPLYSRVYERYRGGLLPPPKALERELIAFGVAQKVADRARQVFDRSARQSGYFDSGDNRLVRPKIDNATHSAGTADTSSEKGHSDGSEYDKDRRLARRGDDTLTFHPFIEGLLKTLPETGSVWSVKDRAKWLRLAANAFDLIYEGDGEIEIKAIVEIA